MWGSPWIPPPRWASAPHSCIWRWLPAADDPAFTPEPFGRDVQNLLSGLREQAARVLDLLKDSVAGLPDEFIDLAGAGVEPAQRGS